MSRTASDQGEGTLTNELGLMVIDHRLLEVLVHMKVAGRVRNEKEIARINGGLCDAGITPPLHIPGE